MKKEKGVIDHPTFNLVFGEKVSKICWGQGYFILGIMSVEGWRYHKIAYFELLEASLGRITISVD